MLFDLDLRLLFQCNDFAFANLIQMQWLFSIIEKQYLWTVWLEKIGQTMLDDPVGNRFRFLGHECLIVLFQAHKLDLCPRTPIRGWGLGRILDLIMLIRNEPK